MYKTNREGKVKTISEYQFNETVKVSVGHLRGVGSMSTMGAWAPINTSSGVNNGYQHTVLYITEKMEIF